MHAMAVKTPGPAPQPSAAVVKHESAAEGKAASAVMGSPQQVPLWADRALPPVALASAPVMRFSLDASAPDEDGVSTVGRADVQVLRKAAPRVQRKTCACGRT